jgi:hypothetical protein
MPREQALHYYLESTRYTYADRGAYLADPDFFDVPLRGLLSKDFAATRRALITETAAASPVAPGDPYPYNEKPGKGEASVTSTIPGSTTHLTVSDRRRNVVSYTFTIESTGGSGLVVPGYGFLLNNELTDFNFDSLTHPNRVEGGKRPRSSMAPTIVLEKRRPFLAVGSPGGSMIPTTVLQILLDRIDLGLTLPQAIADPRASQRNTAATAGEPAFNASAEATARNTALIGLILFGAYVLNYVFVSLGVPQALAKLVGGMPLPPWGIMLLIIGFYLALGTFMEGFSMVVTTIPVVFPVVVALGYDPIWFGVVVTMMVEIALISPPDGTVLYVLQGMRKDGGPITDVFTGVMPFLSVYVLAVVILMAFPQIALWIPSQWHP